MPPSTKVDTIILDYSLIDRVNAAYLEMQKGYVFLYIILSVVPFTSA